MLFRDLISPIGIGSVRNDLGITGLTQLNFRFKALKKTTFTCKILLSLIYLSSVR